MTGDDVSPGFSSANCDAVRVRVLVARYRSQRNTWRPRGEAEVSLVRATQHRTVIVQYQYRVSMERFSAPRFAPNIAKEIRILLLECEAKWTGSWKINRQIFESESTIYNNVYIVRT